MNIVQYSELEVIKHLLTFAVKIRAQNVRTDGILMIEKSSLYVSVMPFVSSLDGFTSLFSFFKSATKVVVIKKMAPQKNRKSEKICTFTSIQNSKILLYFVDFILCNLGKIMRSGEKVPCSHGCCFLPAAEHRRESFTWQNRPRTVELEEL